MKKFGILLAIMLVASTAFAENWYDTVMNGTAKEVAQALNSTPFSFDRQMVRNESTATWRSIQPES